MIRLRPQGSAKRKTEEIVGYPLYWSPVHHLLMLCVATLEPLILPDL